MTPSMDPDFNPYAAPSAKIGSKPVPPGFGLWREGDVLVMRKEAELPDRCVKCNAPADGYRLKRKLGWHHPAFYLIILVALLLYVIVALCVRKTATVQVPLCEDHRSRRKRTILLGWLFSLGGLAAMIAGIALSSDPGATGGLAAALIPTGFLVLIVALVWSIVASQPVVPLKIDQQFVWLKKVCPAFLDSLPEVPDYDPVPTRST